MRIKRALHLLDGVRKKDEIDEMLEDALKDEVGGYNFYVKYDHIVEFAQAWAMLSPEEQDIADGVLADWSFEADPFVVEEIYGMLGGHDLEIDKTFENWLNEEH